MAADPEASQTQLDKEVGEAADIGASEASHSSEDLFNAPDGGLKAWLVAIGATCIFFATLGFANSYGVLQEYYEAHQLHDKSPDDITWIGSVSIFLQFALGAIGGPMFDRFGAWIVRPAAVLYVVSIMMTSLCKKYWQFMLAQGILMGAVNGFLQFPAMAAVSQYFDKKRAAALGLAVSGSSVGGIVIPIALTRMFDHTSLGFGWSLRIIGFVVTPLLAFSCLTVTARLPPRSTTFFIPSAFKEKTYLFLIISLFFMFLGMFPPLFFIPTYAVTRGMDVTLASYLLAILNAASTFGRVIPGILADKFGRLNAFATGGIVTGIIIFCMDKAESNAALIVYSVIFGFSSGTIISGGSAAFTLCPKDPRDLGTYIGMGLGAASLAALAGPPISGKFVDVYGGFFEMSMFCGATCLFGGFLALVSKAMTPQGLFGRI
ncbi:MFS general substrate transporter [Aspergillus ellipticus CBS 707.79]|uniref:MFS general substrate transporter n=1 Tax=Aspergillus ellipticus CBS 707.79 TaxID=1448320 RepID=A0A319DQ09_9EURO|nr:MFS general substrate transporter [Aspergillus ellipticus CBS 707.79]